MEPIQEDSGLGNISINNEVVAEIVAMAAREVPGVVSLAGGSIKDDIAGLFGGRRDSTASVGIREVADGSYHISVKLILTFGVQLAKVAQSVQVAIREQVENMTNKDVSKVDVIVDGIRREEAPVEDHPES
ncbi:MAG TPA: Asp23/Gls24 family envelope stress response protein [Oceanipulchritudo sp.]|nr:Asp23/Gls24 family envelope stress response protein [Oceanipulchritudo sp.]